MAYKDQDEELEAERANGDRLAAALDAVLTFMRDDEREALKAVLIIPRACQLTLGHVTDGAQALHQLTIDKRVY